MFNFFLPQYTEYRHGTYIGHIFPARYGQIQRDYGTCPFNHKSGQSGIFWYTIIQENFCTIIILEGRGYPRYMEQVEQHGLKLSQYRDPASGIFILLIPFIRPQSVARHGGTTHVMKIALIGKKSRNPFFLFISIFFYLRPTDWTKLARHESANPGIN